MQTNEMSHGHDKDELSRWVFVHFSCSSSTDLQEHPAAVLSVTPPLNPTSPLQRAKLYKIACDSLRKIKTKQLTKMTLIETNIRVII